MANEAPEASVTALNAALVNLGVPAPAAAGDPFAADAYQTAFIEFIQRMGFLIPNDQGAGGVELPTFANNAAATGGGLAIGQFYRITGTDGVAQVHA